VAREKRCPVPLCPCAKRVRVKPTQDECDAAEAIAALASNLF